MNTPILFIGLCRLRYNWKTEILEKCLKFLTLLLYVFAVFFAQDVIFFDVNDDCPNKENNTVTNARYWLIIEIIQFYQGFLTATLFACMAKIYKKEKDFTIMTGKEPDDDEEEEVDLFIEATLTFEMFSQYLNPLILTCVITFLTYTNIEYEGLSDYKLTLIVMIIFHLVQVLFVIWVIYGYKKIRDST